MFAAPRFFGLTRGDHSGPKFRLRLTAEDDGGDGEPLLTTIGRCKHGVPVPLGGDELALVKRRGGGDVDDGATAR